MEDVAVLRVGHVAVVRSGDLLQDLSCDGARVRLRGGEFRQNDGSPRDERIEDRHERTREREIRGMNGWDGFEMGNGGWIFWEGEGLSRSLSSSSSLSIFGKGEERSGGGKLKFSNFSFFPFLDSYVFLFYFK